VVGGIKIPKGKTIRISVNTKPILSEYDMIIESDVTLSLSSSFEPFLGGGSGKLIDAIGAISKKKTGHGFSSKFKQLGIQTWTGTDPMSVSSVTIGFYIDRRNPDAYKQVFLPIMELCKLPLPSEGGELGSLIAPGPTVAAAFEGEEEKGEYSDIIGIEIGNIIRIPNAIIKKAEPTFSNETDENDYPIWGKVSLDIISVFTATKQALDTTFNGQQSGGGSPPTTSDRWRNI